MAASDRGDGASAALMVASARSQLGDINERYAGAALAVGTAGLCGGRSASVVGPLFPGGQRSGPP